MGGEEAVKKNESPLDPDLLKGLGRLAEGSDPNIKIQELQKGSVSRSPETSAAMHRIVLSFIKLILAPRIGLVIPGSDQMDLNHYFHHLFSSRPFVFGS